MSMILTRMGNKRKMAAKLYQYFPPHRMRIELFFGAGGSFFYTPLPKYAILNDYDDDVTNLYLVIQRDRKALERAITQMPVSQSLVSEWKNSSIQNDPVLKAVRFLLLSNFTYLCKGDTLRLGLDNTKRNLIKAIEPTFEYLQNAKLLNVDFREVLGHISFTKGLNDKENCFNYLDPIYHDTEYTYRVPTWTETDTMDCLDIVATCGIKSAMSEFAHPFVLAAARERGLNIITLGERQNLKKRSTEILITNYLPNMQEKLQLI